MKKILLIEDDKKKIDDIETFVKDKFPEALLIIEESYLAGLGNLMKNKYDLLLLDMSLPTWESMEYEGVPSFEKFGGYKILKEMKRKEKYVQTILITMFDDFGESDSSITLKQIDKVLNENFSKFYSGYVFYNSRESNWKSNLEKALMTVLK